MSILNTHNLAGISRKVYFSLYLSSLLMSGLAILVDMQTKYLLQDVKWIVLKIGEKKKPTIDLNKSLNKAKVTLEELNLCDVPPDFGCFSPISEPRDHVIFSEYFLITTPKSSEEGTPGVSEIPREEENSFHRARREDITLTDAVPFQSEEPIPELEEAVDFLAPPLAFVPPPTQPESNQPPFDLDAVPVPYDIEKPIFMTPEIIEEESPAEQPREVPLVQAPESVPKTRVPSESSDGFVLPPAVPAPKRSKRKRHLIVDARTSLTGDQIKKNIASANSNLTTPLAIPSTLEPAKSLMTRLGSGHLVLKGIRERLKKLQTLPQPEEEKTSREERDELPSRVRRRISVSESVEQERAVLDSTKDPSQSGLMKSASLRTFETSTPLDPSLSARQPEAVSPLPFFGEEDYENAKSVPDIESFRPISETRLSMPFDVGTPGPDIDMARPEETYLPEKSRGKECIITPVSPERTPPPPSPPRIHEILAEAFDLIKETAASSIIPNVTTFSAVLENTLATKKRVASLFNSLLCLHAEKKIVVQQPVAGAEIFIELTC